MNALRALRSWMMLVLATASLALPGVARAEDPLVEVPEIGQPTPEIAVRGSTVTVPGNHLPTKPGEIALMLGYTEIKRLSSVSADGRSLKFVVPDSAPLGPQLLRLGVGQPRSWLVPSDFPIGFLRVVADSKEPLTLSKASLSVVAPDSAGFSLIGEGMGGDIEDYVLLRDGSAIKLCAAKKPDCLAARFISRYELELFAPFDKAWLGVHELKLRRGDVTADGSVSLRFMAYSTLQVQTRSLGVSVLLLLFIAGLALVGPTYRIAPEKLIKNSAYRFTAFLIDPETDTYSLSKLQFYLWSVTALIGYTYLTLARAFAQGHLELVDIPENLPGILAVSSGTTVLSMVATTVRGPKGAGPASPSISDLVCVGGVVSPDRFQFLLWTLVAIGSFLFSVYMTDPASISDLPGIPSRLLWLSGVSAAGYLGGKMARKPGPVIDQIRIDPSSFALDIVGRNLDANAMFEIGQGHPLEHYLIPNETDGRLASVRERARTTSTTPDAATTDFATILRLRLRGLPEDVVGQSPPFTLTVINSDGQRASWPFEADGAAVTQWSVSPTSAAPPPTTPVAPPRATSVPSRVLAP